MTVSSTDQIAKAVEALVRHDELHPVDKVLGKYLALMPPAEWGGRYRVAAFRMLGKYALRLKMYGVRIGEITEPPPSADSTTTGTEGNTRSVSVNCTAFLLHFPFDQQLLSAAQVLPQARFSQQEKAWRVPMTLAAAEQVAGFAELHGFAIAPEFFTALDALAEKAVETAAASRAQEAGYHVKGLKISLRPYQQAGVRYCVDRMTGAEHGKGAFLCDEMGLGKTPQALAVVQDLMAWPCLVVCPASLKYNWAKEAAAWLGIESAILPDCLKDAQWQGVKGMKGAPAYKLPSGIVSDGGRKARLKAEREVADAIGEKLVIVNYDNLAKLVPLLKKMGFRSVIFDESHTLRNGKAQKTVAAKDFVSRNRSLSTRLCLSGTPVVNGIADLIPQLSLLRRLDDLGGFWAFAERYCAAKKTEHGWDLSGRSNAEELHERLRATCFIRRRKREVLPELPPKVRATVPLLLDNQEEYDRAAEDIVEWIKGARAARNDEARMTNDEEERLRECEALLKFEALKQISVKGKMAGAKAWLANFLESGEKLVVFAEHTEVIDELAAHFECPKIYGGTPAKERQRIVDAFQKDGALKLIICNIKAAGVGITLTAASNFAFLEQGWNPATMDQAEDRGHRFGQKRSVTCWYLMGKGTIDWDIHGIIRGKRGMVNAVVDGEGGEAGPGVIRELLAAMGGFNREGR